MRTDAGTTGPETVRRTPSALLIVTRNSIIGAKRLVSIVVVVTTGQAASKPAEDDTECEIPELAAGVGSVRPGRHRVVESKSNPNDSGDRFGVVGQTERKASADPHGESVSLSEG